MEEVEVYTFDNQDYIVIDKINEYLYLSNEKDSHDMMIRKVDSNDDTLLLPLDSDEEFENALLLLTRKKVQEEGI
ncbi:MAG TPA: hypothetical protein IAB35_04860 [Candidatus Faecimonas gallistercoris]|nr:hypothetical protein [Candidatus Faecimonas gallistercoris]